MSRFARRVDDNHQAIVDALRKVGCSVQSLASAGDGVPDLLVGYRGRDWKLEIKDGRKVPSAQKLTPDQEHWHRVWRGTPVHVVRTVDEALAVVLR